MSKELLQIENNNHYNSAVDKSGKSNLFQGFYCPR
jgi:hypothetical protein